MTRNKSLKRSAAGATAALFLSAGPVLAQVPPATQDQQSAPPASSPDPRSPFWGEDGYDYGRDRRPADRRDRDDYDDEKTFAESFPVDLAALVAPARARYMALKWSYTTAQRRLDQRIDQLRAEFEDSQDYRDLQLQREEAQRAFDEARRQSLAPLQDDPQYQALTELQQQLEQKISDAHRSPNRDMDQIRAMSELAMDYARQRREMETGLTGTDSSISSTQEQLRELGLRIREQEEQFARELRTHEELAMLRDQIQQLRIEYLAAGGYYDSVVRTADVATDFAYFNSVMQSGYYSNPYGYGYGYPYGGFGFHGKNFGGGIIIGGVGIGDGGTGPIRLRPVLFPSPILSNTFRGVNQTPIPFIPTGNEAPPIPIPEDE